MNNASKYLAELLGTFLFMMIGYASVAAFGMILRDSPHKGSASFDSVLELAEEGVGSDRSGYRQEFLKLVEQASQLDHQGTRR